MVSRSFILSPSVDPETPFPVVSTDYTSVEPISIKEPSLWIGQELELLKFSLNADSNANLSQVIVDFSYMEENFYDNITAVRIYEDVNSNGIVDSGEPCLDTQTIFSSNSIIFYPNHIIDQQQEKYIVTLVFRERDIQEVDAFTFYTEIQSSNIHLLDSTYRSFYPTNASNVLRGANVTVSEGAFPVDMVVKAVEQEPDFSSVAVGVAGLGILMGTNTDSSGAEGVAQDVW